MLFVYGVGVRRAVAGVAIVSGLAVFAPPVGERDRTELRVINALEALTTELARLSRDERHHDTLVCLATSSCVPRVSAGNPFIDANWQLPRGSGYHLVYHVAPQTGLAPKPHARSATRVAVVAVPVNIAATQYRSFCTDDRQSIFFSPAGTMPAVEAGRCLDTARIGFVDRP